VITHWCAILSTPHANFWKFVLLLWRYNLIVCHCGNTKWDSICEECTVNNSYFEENVQKILVETECACARCTAERHWVTISCDTLLVQSRKGNIFNFKTLLLCTTWVCLLSHKEDCVRPSHCLISQICASQQGTLYKLWHT
jgi:hypothetical protein